MLLSVPPQRWGENPTPPLPSPIFFLDLHLFPRVCLCLSTILEICAYAYFCISKAQKAYD